MKPSPSQPARGGKTAKPTFRGAFALAYLVVIAPAATLIGWNLAASMLTAPDDFLNVLAVALFLFVVVHALVALRSCLRPAYSFSRRLLPMKFWTLMLALFAVSCAKVEPGYVGIKVNQYGNQKGVEDFPLQTGRVTYNPFTTDVYKFPTFRQNVIWTKDEKDDGADDSMTFNSVEGSVVNADLALSYSLMADKVPLIFVTFRKDIEHITHIYIRSEVRDAIARHASTMKVIDIFGSRKQELLEAVKADLNARLGPSKIGFDFEMVSFIGGLRCDKNVMESINATIQATQLAISAQNKIVQATAEADQAIQTARGEAQSRLLNADAQAKSNLLIASAQAEANLMVSKSLTPELIRWKALERWDGRQPQVLGAGSLPLLQIDTKP